MKQRILLFDTSAVLHSVKFSLAKQKLSHREKPTFIVFGFLLKLQFLMNKTRPNVVVFATDSLKSKRKKIYPVYKEHRAAHNKTPEQQELDKISYPQFEQVIDYVLPQIGFRNIFKARGYEADDIIAKICKEYQKQEIIIVSRDGDLYQLLEKTTCMLFPQNNTYFSKQNFKRKYKINPKQWKKVKTLAGCNTDGVAGIEGIGEKRAIQYIKGELPKNYKAFKNIESKEGKTIAKRNKKLVVLPFKGTPSFKIKPDHTKKKKLIRIAEEFGFASILADIDSWAKALKAY